MANHFAGQFVQQMLQPSGVKGEWYSFCDFLVVVQACPDALFFGLCPCIAGTLPFSSSFTAISFLLYGLRHMDNFGALS